MTNLGLSGRPTLLIANALRTGRPRTNKLTINESVVGPVVVGRKRTVKYFFVPVGIESFAIGVSNEKFAPLFMEELTICTVKQLSFESTIEESVTLQSVVESIVRIFVLARTGFEKRVADVICTVS